MKLKKYEAELESYRQRFVAEIASIHKSHDRWLWVWLVMALGAWGFGLWIGLQSGYSEHTRAERAALYGVCQ